MEWKSWHNYCIIFYEKIYCIYDTKLQYIRLNFKRLLELAIVQYLANKRVRVQGCYNLRV